METRNPNDKDVVMRAFGKIEKHLCISCSLLGAYAGGDYSYLPKKACEPRPESSQINSKDFSLWGFLTAGVVISSVVGNLVSNINNNNNNNNNNNKQVSNNNRNDNFNSGENSNMNTNMIVPGRRRSFQGDGGYFSGKYYSSKYKSCVSLLLCKYLETQGSGWLLVHHLKICSWLLFRSILESSITNLKYLPCNKLAIICIINLFAWYNDVMYIDNCNNRFNQPDCCIEMWIYTCRFIRSQRN